MVTPSGLLFFPVTPFSGTGEVDIDAFKAHVAERVADGAGCIFAACGTGEFHALAPEEHRAVTAAAVAAADGRVPVYVGVGGSVVTAKSLAVASAAEGASGILLMPPYLVSGPQRGLIGYISAIANATDLPVIVYQRSQMCLSPESAVEVSRIPNVIGLKDGVGDIAQMQQIVTAIRADGNSDFLFFNGLPTAELTMPAYRAIGVPLYSSAVFAFAPDIALAFYTAININDHAAIDALLRSFFIPFSKIRDRQAGYQISLVKAAVTARNRPVGGVRPPLVDPSIADTQELGDLLRDVRRGRPYAASSLHCSVNTR